MTPEPIHATDLFCGGGGTSTGLAQACKNLGCSVDLVAINHWQQAIETHKLNHPWATHLCVNVEAVDPRKAVPGGHLDALVASPECTFHSRAAGGRPINDQRRSSAWQILRWVELLEVDALLIENVPEFRNWAPLDEAGHPIKERKGAIYRSYIEAIKSFDYNVEARVLNAADYGAPTSRSRLFIQARKGTKPLNWPAPTHSKTGKTGKRWRAAKEIIDWATPSKSIFGRKKPLSPRTYARIIEGLKRFGGPELQPFIILMEHAGGIKTVDDPLPTITTAHGGTMGLVQPSFILSQGSGGAPRSTDSPMPTIPTKGAHALIMPMFGERKGQKMRVKTVEKPLDTVTSHGAGALVQPFILPVEGYYNKGDSHNPPRSLDKPLGTITQRGYGGVVEPFLQQYNGNSAAQPVTDPLPTVSTKDRFALVQPVINGCALDIKFRMLKPSELSAAMGFPEDYQWAGNQTETVKMIGNAVSVDIARALCTSLLTEPANCLSYLV